MSSCNCNYNLPPSYTVAQCHFCNSQIQNAEQTQRRIWHQVRVGSSTYTLNKAALAGAASILKSNSFTNWNQLSDQAVAHRQTAYHPTHGNSLRSTLTSHRPGAGAPGGVGVDVKHDSYARFLNKKKGQVLRTQTVGIASKPVEGNKIRKYGLIQNSVNCCSQPR